ncbi:MAG: formylglycine-generating enzyme family protein [Chitinispirillales bacterium]|jgi:formylglycine-generating enzyme required for sulfatase activity|nr:formylglycine-generating enzyme family protein [Chitinispirillales bacterium]
MKKILTILLTLSLCSIAFAQENRAKPTVAVYMAGQEPRGALGVHKVMGGELVKAISRSEKYTAVNRTDAILAQLSKEHVYQRSGAVNDDQIKAIGQQLGVQYLCIVEISDVKGGTFYIEVQLVDVVTAEAVASATASSDLRTNQDMMIAAQYVARDLVGGGAPQSKRGNVEIEMVFVQGGTFMMGCSGRNAGNCEKDEKPAHKVTLGDFQIGKYEVTQKQWSQVMGSNPSHFKGDNLPVGKVSWYDVQEFIEKLNALTGKKYRLPTEAEWEFAARGGVKSTGFAFAGGNNAGDVAWYKSNSGGKCHAVGSRGSNELGIYDMSGNVWEWVNDWSANYNSADSKDPSGPATGNNRVLRGGSWPYDASYCRVSYRNGSAPGNRGADVGFRLAISP